MKRLAIGVVAGGLLGTAFGFALGIFIYPFWFLQETATEQLAESPTRLQVAGGDFIHANPRDPIHWGKGRVTIFGEADGSMVVFLHEDFEVGPGPRFHVYLVDHPEVRANSDFQSSKQLDLGRLRAFKGSQVFDIPRGTDLGGYKSVVIWCKEFNVLISPATLRVGGV